MIKLVASLFGGTLTHHLYGYTDNEVINEYISLITFHNADIWELMNCRQVGQGTDEEMSRQTFRIKGNASWRISFMMSWKKPVSL